MKLGKQEYLDYWRQLKFYLDEHGQDWTFASFEGEKEIVVKIGTPKYKVNLSLAGPDTRSPRHAVAAGFWIPDSKEDFARLKARKSELQAAMGKPLMYDSKLGRKSCWIWVAAPMDLTIEKNWPGSFVWFAEYAKKLRDVCHDHLA